ncbi:hypothetical protein Tco_0981957 [Tanacetum coccineum]
MLLVLLLLISELRLLSCISAAQELQRKMLIYAAEGVNAASEEVSTAEIPCIESLLALRLVSAACSLCSAVHKVQRVPYVRRYRKVRAVALLKGRWLEVYKDDLRQRELNMQLTKVEGRVQNIMEFKEVSIKEIQHEHPLFPEDLQLIYINYDEGDDDFDDSELIEKQKFNCVCNMCGLGIDWYHRYYYKCRKSSCHYSLHKSCAEISATLKFSAHPSHILYLKKVTTNWSCSVCFTNHEAGFVKGKYLMNIGFTNAANACSTST